MSAGLPSRLSGRRLLLLTLCAVATLIAVGCGVSSTSAAAAQAPAEQDTEQPVVEATQQRTAAEEQPDVMTALGSVFEETPGWAWFALFGGILAGLIAGKIAQATFRRSARRLHEQERQAAGVVLEDVAGPASLALLTLGIRLGLIGVVMPVEIAAFASNVVQLLYTLAIGWFVYNLVDLIDIVLSRHIEKSQSKLAAQIAPLVRKAIRIFVIIIFVLFIAQNVFGVNITAWLAGLGIAGLAVSLAAQDSIKNLFGSLTVMLDKPFTVGDRIQFASSDGFVEEIGFRSTKLRTFTGHLVTIPNMQFIDGKVENISARPFLRRSMDVTITYDTPPEKVDQAVQIIKDLLNAEDLAEPFRIEERPPRVFFNDFNSTSLNIAVSYWYFLDETKGHDWWHYQAHADIFNRRLLVAFNEAGIEFAFPTQTLHLAGDPSRRLTVHTVAESSETE